MSHITLGAVDLRNHGSFNNVLIDPVETGNLYTVILDISILSISDSLGGSALIYGSEKKQPKTAIYCRKVSRVA